MIDKSKVQNILFITLSNIGDVVLTLPVLGVLEREFPAAGITVMVGPAAEEIFQNDRRISRIISYDKHIPFLEKIKLGLKLRKENFDLAVDLRSTLYPVLAGAHYKTPLFSTKDKKPAHKKYVHLNKLASLGLKAQDSSYNLSFNDEEKTKIKNIFKELNISGADTIIAIAPGAKSHIKRWTTDGFKKVCERLTKELGVKVLLIGDNNDKQITSQILSSGLNNAYDVSGRTNLHELGYLLSRCKLLITNDSAPLHLADLVNTPSVAIFGI